ncbi:imidazole glycerol phosphate synthase subunit HisH [Iodidimonas sp. SYSU 1G8]|uniref:imidazole glycerol phosphate synthase subunit HisH n=1 Tax=Iodidimonas sp. SYSU 1G8 TaxID=3133967 RepID=UPI0031FED5C6
MATAETVAIIDYGSGNLRSAEKAFARAAAEAGTGQDVFVTADPATIAAAGRIVLPGVGAFADCRRGLLAIDGMGEALEDAVRRRRTPFFGICVGMQLMAEWGHEHGRHAGLGWLKGTVEPIAPADPALKIPHMGWNDLRIEAAHPVLDGIAAGTHVYFVHSYAFHPADPADLLASVDYGGPVTALVGRDNMIGSQFHPEKSQDAGLRLIANFLRWQP